MMPKSKPRWSAARILVVEDDMLVRTVMVTALRQSGFEAIEAANADVAWSYVTSGGEVDLVFTDIQMPGSMDGTELVRRLRNARPGLPIIMTSSLACPNAVGSFLPKPDQPSEVVSIIHETLDAGD